MKCMYTSSPGNIADGSEIIKGSFIQIAMSCIHELICTCAMLSHICCWPKHDNNM